MTARLILIALLATATLAAAPVDQGNPEHGRTAQTRPLPEHEPFVKATRDNLIRSQREQFAYAYKERRSEFHVNPFGRVGTGGMQGFEVTPVDNGTVIVKRLIERDGKPITDGDVERIPVKEEKRRPGRRTTMEDIVATLSFKLDRREVIHGRDVIVVQFTPREDARPETSEGRIAKVFKGAAWVDEALHQVIRIEATAIDDISFGFGFLARLDEGTTVTLTREAVNDSTWLPSSIRFAGQGRALLFRKMNVDQRIEWSDYRRVD